MEGEDLIGKKVKLIFQDVDAEIIKIGHIQNISKGFLTLKTKRKTEIIPKTRILRMEILREGEYKDG